MRYIYEFHYKWDGEENWRFFTGITEKDIMFIAYNYLRIMIIEMGIFDRIKFRVFDTIRNETIIRER